MTAKLIFEDNTTFEGLSFGAEKSMAGEVVFATGMVGYPEAFTDPSFAGQILVLTYPIIGNYGVPDKKHWESDRLQIAGLVVSHYTDTPSHYQSTMTLGEWLQQEQVPALEIKDTRFLAQKLRDKGAMLGKITLDHDVKLYDPNQENLVANVSTPDVLIDEPETKTEKTIILIDCGAKRNIRRSLLKRGVRVITVPWDYDFFEHLKEPFDGILISNGPGDPKFADKTIAIVKKALEQKIPTLGVCLGNQLLALAAGGDTYKLKFGHRSQNQPCILQGTRKCYITTQNHGFAVGQVPDRFKPWFLNANDDSNEGIIHETLPFMSVQFHPEATPGPVDTDWIFDYFLEKVK